MVRTCLVFQRHSHHRSHLHRPQFNRLVNQVVNLQTYLRLSLRPCLRVSPLLNLPAFHLLLLVVVLLDSQVVGQLAGHQVYLVHDLVFSQVLIRPQGRLFNPLQNHLIIQLHTRLHNQRRFLHVNQR